ncbi:unnamed protein product [Arabidopsis thaliana]|uniref:Uncharacterized protein n=1 Tax=Arabidopsis thaliana TaxID=3702 RepID=A0A654EYK8_ARATH|nr:unnamed protein product [Arabidopsis thaliana]
MLYQPWDACWSIAPTRHLDALFRKAGLLRDDEELSIQEIIDLMPRTKLLKKKLKRPIINLGALIDILKERTLLKNGFDEYESLLKQSIRISPIAARLIIVNEDYKAIEGKSIYLRGELTSEDGGHIVLLTGFGVDANDRAFWKAQDAYGRGSDKEMMGTQ